MTSKREWKRRALAAEASQVKFIDGYRVATPLLSRDASGRVTVDWDGKGDVVLMTIELFMQYVDTHNERIDAIAERDRARDTAAAAEAEIARIKAAVEGLGPYAIDYDERIRLSTQPPSTDGHMLSRAQVMACFDVPDDEPTPESIMRDFDALEATGWLGP